MNLGGQNSPHTDPLEINTWAGSYSVAQGTGSGAGGPYVVLVPETPARARSLPDGQCLTQSMAPRDPGGVW